VDLDKLEHRPLFRRTVWKRNGYLLLTLTLELLLLYALASVRVGVDEEGWAFFGYRLNWEPISLRTIFWVGLFVVSQVAFAEWGFLQSLDTEGHVTLYPKDQSDGRRFGDLTGPEIVEAVQDLAKHFGVGKVSRIVVSDRPDPNAMTAHVFGLWNVVVLHSNLLEVLPGEGVRAVIAHELAHVRRWDSIVYQIVRLPASFSGLIATLAFFRMIGGAVGGVFEEDPDWWLTATRLFGLLLAFSATVWAFSQIGRLANLASQQSEHMADAYAAEACGWQSQLNALLLIGERAEALTVLTQALGELPGRLEEAMTEPALMRLLRRFPPRELDQTVAREVAPRLFIEDRLEQMRQKLCVPLDDEQIRDLAARGGRELRRSLDAEKQKGEPNEDEEQRVEQRLTDWRRYDRDRSGHLDLAEVAALVSELRNHPDRMLFRQFLTPGVEWEIHPTMRHRILFLYDLYASS
jgi:Zn-dependent protease with chaperone function